MAKRKKKESSFGCGCLLILLIGVGFIFIATRPLPPPENPNQIAAENKRGMDDRIRVLTEKEASLRQSAAEYRAKAKAEMDRNPEGAEANEKLAREQDRHYGHKKHEGNARYADQLADETRREIERIKAGGSQ